MLLAPRKAATINKYMMVYKDSLRDIPIDEIAVRFKLKIPLIKNIIKFAANYCDYNLDRKEEIQVALEKANDRKGALRKMIELSKTEFIEAKERYKFVVQCLAEMRREDELIYRLKGLLKMNIIQNQDNRSVTVIHNMGKKELPAEADLSLKNTVMGGRSRIDGRS